MFPVSLGDGPRTLDQAARIVKSVLLHKRRGGARRASVAELAEDGRKDNYDMI